MKLNFKQWFESDPGPTQLTPYAGPAPNPMQIPINLPKPKRGFLVKTPKPLGELTPNFPNDKRDF